MFEGLRWRYWRCPRTVAAAAAHFLHDQNTPRFRSFLADLPAWSTTDFIRRIGIVYGLGDFQFDRETDSDMWTVGWNRQLLADCNKPDDPQAAAARILARVCELARAPGP